jgi:hypothetical protein
VLEALASMLAFALCYLASGLFALGQSVHLKSVDPLAPVPAPSGQKRHKLLATSLLAGAFAPLFATQGGSFGFLLWVMLLSAAALSLSFTLSWRPGWLQPIARLVACIRR